MATKKKSTEPRTGKWAKTHTLLSKIEAAIRAETYVDALAFCREAVIEAKKFCDIPGRERSIGNTVAYTLEVDLLEALTLANKGRQKPANIALGHVLALQKILVRETAMGYYRRPPKRRRTDKVSKETAAVIDLFEGLIKLYGKKR